MISDKSWDVEGCNDRQKNGWKNLQKITHKKHQMRKPEKTQKDTWENLKKTGKITRHEQTWKQITVENLKKIIQKKHQMRKPEKTQKDTWENLKEHGK